MKKISGIIVDVHNEKQFPGTICIENGRITDIIEKVYEDCVPYPVNNAGFKKLPYILPGFVDSYINMEMTQISPAEYARTAVSQGVIGALVDCSDTSSILGKPGILRLIENSRGFPFYFGFSAPSAIIKGKYNFSDIEELLSMKEVTHLCEIKDFPSVILHEPATEVLFSIAKKHGKPADGFSPVLSDINLDEYCKSYISTDHGCGSITDAQAKIDKGLKLKIQRRLIEDYPEILGLFENKSDKLMFCSEIIYGGNIPKGYINKIISSALQANVDLYKLLRAASVNPAEHYKLDMGLLRKDDKADFIIVDSLFSMDVLETYINGECVYHNLELKKNPDGSMSLDSVKESDTKLEAMNLFDAKKISCDDLKILTYSNQNEVLCNVIDVMSDELCTSKASSFLKVRDGEIMPDIENDILKIVLVSRLGTFKPFAAFVHGFKIKKGALAISISHKEHNIIAVGTNDKDIMNAVNEVVEMNGGKAFSVDGELKLSIPFEFEGLLTTKRFEEFQKAYAKTDSVLRGDMGTTIKRPIKVLSYLADCDIPTIKMSPAGLFNVATQQTMSIESK